MVGSSKWTMGFRWLYDFGGSIEFLYTALMLQLKFFKKILSYKVFNLRNTLRAFIVEWFFFLTIRQILTSSIYWYNIDSNRELTSKLITLKKFKFRLKLKFITYLTLHINILYKWLWLDANRYFIKLYNIIINKFSKIYSFILYLLFHTSLVRWWFE